MKSSRTDGTVLERYSAPVVKDGRHYGRIWTFHDITHRKLTEESLRRSEATMRSILSASPIGIAVQNADRAAHWFNASMSSITGYTQEEIRIYGARKVYESDEEYQRVKEVVWGEIEKGADGTTDTRWVRKDGTMVDVHLCMAPIDHGDLSRAWSPRPPISRPASLPKRPFGRASIAFALFLASGA